MKIKRNNSWVYTATVDIDPGQSAKLAIDLGTSNGLDGLKFRIKTFGAGLASHKLRLYEERVVSNTNDPAQGRNRFRETDGLEAEFLATLGLNPSTDIFLFHAPGTFTDGLGGLLLYEQVCPTANVGDTGKWNIRNHHPTLTPQYLMAEIESLDSLARPFTFVVEYGFVRKHG